MQLDRMLRRIHNLVRKLRLLRPVPLNQWCEYSIPLSTVLNSEDMSNLPVDVRFLHVHEKGDRNRRVHISDVKSDRTEQWVASFAAIRLRTNLLRLRLCNCGLGDDAVRLICSSFPQLVWLNLRTN